MKISVLVLTTLAALAQSTPLPAPQTDVTASQLHARQLPNPFALIPLIAEIPQGAYYLFSSPVNLAKAFGSSAVDKGAGGLNKLLDFLDKKRKGKNGPTPPGGKEGAELGAVPGPGAIPGPGAAAGPAGPTA
ncbi:hypothetical protein CP532_2509 [Ophiocordyceps camponoti-leonardi (nom. inval.)]|nr:hypothetical protein CP532_2509 [Ophiocordyceps camponoti-leonardi (nom. inval.)]